MTLKPLLGTLEAIIQNHFKSHMLGLMLIGIVSFLKLLEIGMHCYNPFCAGLGSSLGCALDW